MESPHDDEAPPKDPGAQKAAQSYDEKDFEGHRAHTVFVGVHVPFERRHSHRRHKHHHRGSDAGNMQEEDRPSTPPAQRVQFILGEDVDDGTHESHPLFSEMEELVGDGEDMEWRETARWIKFEEVVEEGGNRWSKPHVATLSLHSLFELRSLLLNGTVILDMEAQSLEQIADLVLDNMVNAGLLILENKDKVRDALLKRHRHQHQCKDHVMLPIIRSFAEIGRNHSTSKNGCIQLRLCAGLQSKRKESPAVDVKTVATKRATQNRNGSYISVPVEESSFGGLGKSPEYGKFLGVPGQGKEK